MNNAIISILATYTDLLTSGQLEYRNGGREQFKSRPAAAVPLFDGIRTTDTPGIYWVPSEEQRGHLYRVDVASLDHECSCMDFVNTPPHKCKHILSAIMFHAIAEVLAEAEEPEPAPAPVPLSEYLASKPAPAPTQARPPVGTAERANFESDDTRWLYGKKRATA